MYIRLKYKSFFYNFSFIYFILFLRMSLCLLFFFFLKNAVGIGNLDTIEYSNAVLSSF